MSACESVSVTSVAWFPAFFLREFDSSAQTFLGPIYLYAVLHDRQIFVLNKCIMYDFLCLGREGETFNILFLALRCLCGMTKDWVYLIKF